MFEQSKTEVADERNSRKQPLTDEEAKALLAQAETILIARGRKVLTQTAKDPGPDDLKGPTGNFRAPMVLRGKTLLVGFHRETLEELV